VAEVLQLRAEVAALRAERTAAAGGDVRIAHPSQPLQLSVPLVMRFVLCMERRPARAQVTSGVRSG